MRQLCLVQALDHAHRLVQPAVLIDRADHRLQRIRQNRVAVITAAFEFAAAEFDVLAEIELTRVQRERGLAYQACTQARQIPSASCGKRRLVR